MFVSNISEFLASTEKLFFPNLLDENWNRKSIGGTMEGMGVNISLRLSNCSLT